MYSDRAIQAAPNPVRARSDRSGSCRGVARNVLGGTPGLPSGGAMLPASDAGLTCMMQSQRVRRVGYVMKQLTAIIEREGDAFVSLCPELDVASQGETVTKHTGT